MPVLYVLSDPVYFWYESEFNEFLNPVHPLIQSILIQTNKLLNRKLIKYLKLQNIALNQ